MRVFKNYLLSFFVVTIMGASADLLACGSPPVEDISGGDNSAPADAAEADAAETEAAAEPSRIFSRADNLTVPGSLDDTIQEESVSEVRSHRLIAAASTGASVGAHVTTEGEVIQLHNAIEAGRETEVAALLREGVNPNVLHPDTNQRALEICRNNAIRQMLLAIGAV